jgi:HEAT repeat protein
VRALGDLADASAVPLLLNLLKASAELRPAVLESLGRIGGPDARQALRERVRAAGSGPDARMAYRALAACAGPGDDALLREAALHPDWYVRLTAVDVLARFQHPDNVTALARLTADPVAAVAHRALAVLAG